MSPTELRPDSPEAGGRRRFALTGPSARLDPTTNAVRRDLADVRLADRVFAPHYAAPALRRLTRPTALLSGREPDAASLAELELGAAFEVIEFAGGLAWGVAPGRGLVGYLDADALGPA
jgi:hypothetical protein